MVPITHITLFFDQPARGPEVRVRYSRRPFMLFAIRKNILSAAFLAFSLLASVSSQSAAAQTSDDEQKIKDLLSQLTLQEEIRLLSGSTTMPSTPIDRLHIPAVRM